MCTESCAPWGRSVVDTQVNWPMRHTQRQFTARSRPRKRGTEVLLAPFMNGNRSIGRIIGLTILPALFALDLAAIPAGAAAIPGGNVASSASPIISGGLSGLQFSRSITVPSEIPTHGGSPGQFQMNDSLQLMSNATYRLRLDSPELYASIIANSVITVVLPQGEARAIVERAIQAQGGEAKVAKLRTMRIKAEGTIALVPGQPDLFFTIEDTWQMPGRYKSSSTFQIKGRKVAQTLIINGDKVWMRMNGQTQELPQKAVAEMKEQKYAEDLDRCAFLKESGIELSVLDSIQVDGKSAVGVLVRCAGHREIKLYFDSTSGLLAKREHWMLDPASGKEVLREVIFSDYQEKDGLKHYKRFIAFCDGTKVFDATVTEIEFIDNLDEKVFAKP